MKKSVASWMNVTWKHVGGNISEITCASEQLVFVNVALGVQRYVYALE